MNKLIAALLLLISSAAHAQISAPVSPVSGDQTPSANSSAPSPPNRGGPAAATVIAYGADPAGIADSTSAFQRAITAGGYVGIPCGTYRLNLTIAGKSNFTLDGSPCAILKPYDTAADVIDIIGGNFSIYRGFAIQGAAAGSASGIVISGGAANIRLLGLTIQNFQRYGAACIGTSGDQMSGNDFRDGYALYNGAADIYWTYCNDFHIRDSQFGGSGTRPARGIHLANSSAGQVTGNYIWSNGIGIEADSALYNWIDENRITQSAKQGLLCSACANSNVQNNQFYQNSNSSIGAYESAKFVGSRDILFQGNQFYDWTGVAHTNYSLTIDPASSNFTVTGNEFQDSISPTNSIAPISISPSATGMVLENNTPAQTAYANDCAVSRGGLSSGTGVSGVGGSGSTIYLGSAGAQSTEADTYWLTAAPGLVCSFAILAHAAPGPGQSFTFTLRRNGTGTGVSGTIAGAERTLRVVNPAKAFKFAPGDTLDIQLVSSAGAAASSFQYSVGLGQ